MNETADAQAPVQTTAGWYTDPTDSTQFRRWDGAAWTDSTMANPSGRAALPDAPFRGGAGASAASTRPPLRPAFFVWARVLQVLFVATGLVAATSGGIHLWTVSFVSRVSGDPTSVDQAEADLHDIIEALAGGVGGLLYLATGVLFLIWLVTAYRCNRVDPARLTHSDGWAVGAWFVPILNFFRPFRVVCDLWNAVRETSDGGRPGPDRPLLPAWWAAYLFMLAIDTVERFQQRSIAVLEGPEVIQSIRTASWTGVIGDLVTTVAAGLALILVTRLTAALRRPATPVLSPNVR